MTVKKRKPAKKTADKKEKQAVAPQKTGLAPGGKAVVITLAVVFVLFAAFEVFNGFKIPELGGAPVKNTLSTKAVKGVKRPAYVSSLNNMKYTGITSMRVFGDNLYIIDNERKQIYRFDKNTGEFKHRWDACSSVVEDSKGRMLILYPDGKVSAFDSAYKEETAGMLTGIPGPWWLEIDAKDNIYAVNSQAQKVFKYGPDLKKIAEIGGPGSGKNQFGGLGKIFVSGDELYCMDTPPGTPPMRSIKVFDTEGRFKRAWKIKNLKVFSHLMNLAIIDGYVYINSFEESKIAVYNKNGGFMCTFNTDAAGRVMINYPATLCDGRGDGYIYLPAAGISRFVPIRF